MEKLSHAYIVSSPSENARNAAAFELAEKMLCSSDGARPCRVCRDCRKVRAKVHPDLAVIERRIDDKGKQKKEILVDQVRAMGADAYVLPNEAQAKVYIIKDADTMNEQAQNAALKILEEPPQGVHFILCAANPERLLVTVRSRCVLLSCAGEEDAEDEEAAALADELVALEQGGNVPRLTEWCFEHEAMDARTLGRLLDALRRRYTAMLVQSPDRARIMDIIQLVDRCAEYQTVNTGVKHIFGLLAVGMRKTID